MSDTDQTEDVRPRRRITSEELLAELRRLADELDACPTMADMEERGTYSPSTYQSRFGSWRRAKERSGVSDESTNAEYTDSELLSDLRAFADELGETPTKSEMRASGPHAPSTYASRFESWTDALLEAGLDAPERTGAIPEDDLAAELRRVADALGRRPTSEEFDERGRYSPSTYFRRFDSWQDALDRAGVTDAYPSQSRRHVTDADLETELERMASVLGRPPTAVEMAELGDHSPETYRRRFGSWCAAVREAGLDADLLPTGGQKRRIPAAALLADVERVAEEYGRPPTYQEIQADGQYSGSTYLERFGSWNDALEAAGLEPRRYRGDRIPTRELLRVLRSLALRLGRAPMRTDMERCGPYAGMTYYSRFGSWDDALSAAGIDTRDDGRTCLAGHCDACGRRVERPLTDFPGDDGVFCDETCREVGTQSTIRFESDVLANGGTDHPRRLADAIERTGDAPPSRILFVLQHAVDLLDSEFESAEVDGHQLVVEGDSVRVSWTADGEPRELRADTETVREIGRHCDERGSGRAERRSTE